jgi:hypothetical protein
MTRSKQALPVARAALTSALIGTGLIAVGAFWLSFTALTDLVARAGVNADQAWVWPLIVDGIIVVSTVAVVALVGHGRSVSAYPWALLLVSAGISVAANVAHALVVSDSSVPAVVAAGIAAVPPIALVASTHLSSVLLNRSDRKPRPSAHAPVLSVEHMPPVGAHASRSQSTVNVLPMSALQGWFDDELTAGRTPTGRDVAVAFGVSQATGRRRLAELRSPVTAA